MNIGPFSSENINHVFDHLWTRGKDEIVLLGIPDAREKYMEKIGAPWTFAFYHDDEPCALAYLDLIGDLMWRSNFVATEDGFNKIWMPLTVFMKKISDSLVSEGNGRGSIEAISVYSAKKWFSKIGFDLITLYVYDGFKAKYLKSGNKTAVGHG